MVPNESIDSSSYSKGRHNKFIRGEAQPQQKYSCDRQLRRSVTASRNGLITHSGFYSGGYMNGCGVIFGSFYSRLRCLLLSATTLTFTTIAHADSFGSPPLNGPTPEFNPACTVLSVEGPEIEYWVSWDGPVVAPGLPLTLENFLNCPFGRKILHPIVCITVTMSCPEVGVTAERMCFHAGDGADGKLEVLPTDYRKPGVKGRTIYPPWSCTYLERNF